MNRFGLHAGWVAGVVFILALLVLGASTPGYVHAFQPVSYLGVQGAARAGWWNAFGFVVPGLLVVGFAASLSRPLQGSGMGSAARIGAWLLLISGLAFAGNGVFPYDLDQPEANASKLHVAMLTIALLGFLPAALALSLGLRGRPGWRVLVSAGPVFVLATVASVVQRMWDFVPGLQGHPGYAQRITLLLYFGWLALAAWTALRSARRSPRSGRLGQ